MKQSRIIKLICVAVIAAAANQPRILLACAACYGQSDAPMAHGMNWGIMSLLAVIGMVLACVAGFFVYLARRAVAMQSSEAVGEMTEATNRV